jgi:predicted acylesterase/phospholipase RssA
MIEADPALPTHECDLLMKGGVTSGIVYPRLVERLARDYRLRNIGGTSAGAIAAAAAAAAELGRQGGANPEAFADLGRLPGRLGRPIRGRSRLLRLFQPSAALGRHFEFALSLMTWRGGANALALAAGNLLAPWALGLGTFAAVLAFQLLAATPWHPAWLCALATALPAALIAFAWRWLTRRYQDSAFQARRKRGTPQPADALGALLFLVTLGIVFLHAGLPGSGMLMLVRSLCASAFAAGVLFAWSALAWVRRLAGGIRDNHFGVCSGLTRPGGYPPALTDWLQGYLAQLGGIQGPAPLAFGHLWYGDSGAIDPAAECDCPRDGRRIHLEMVTTALSQHTAYAIPFRRNAGTFYFAPSEWKRLFPQNVLDWLQACEAPSSRWTHPVTGEQLVPLVRDGRLPVIVGVRMSLSFPLLLSAVPLFAIDDTERAGGQGSVKRVWFSDGGITSNLPLQAFDSLLPARPVFTINLKEEHPACRLGHGPAAAADRVFLPQNNGQGIARYWKPFDETGDFAVFRFMAGVVDTMQRWRDEILFPYAAYRDRIAQISLRDDEGGLNLAMSASQIRDLAASGRAAGEMFYRRFHPAAGGSGWANHQRLALLNLLGNVEVLTRKMNEAQQQAAWHDALASGRLGGRTVREACALLNDLAGIGAQLEQQNTHLALHAGRPRPQLRLTPEL